MNEDKDKLRVIEVENIIIDWLRSGNENATLPATIINDLYSSKLSEKDKEIANFVEILEKAKTIDETHHAVKTVILAYRKLQ